MYGEFNFLISSFKLLIEFIYRAWVYWAKNGVHQEVNCDLKLYIENWDYIILLGGKRSKLDKWEPIIKKIARKADNSEQPEEILEYLFHCLSSLENSLKKAGSAAG